ncbi:hypothetical protein Stube_58440 [Streptomyces tubercidicus]|uniref:Uncharacterized protein n=1 Tax=Streptomyces tubercidicus TaxID=47759 RepID=A0A640V2K3_9ACTN|nr:hypothetical protein Stube_58440 [Streptomyces tubercidicus]
MARATVVYALGSMPGSTVAGTVEGAVAGLNAVAGATEAAVSPAASAEAPVAVTTERREGCAPCDRGERCEAREASDASCSSLDASVFFVLGMLTSGVLMSCVLIGHHTWHTSGAEPVHSHGRGR